MKPYPVFVPPCAIYTDNMLNQWREILFLHIVAGVSLIRSEYCSNRQYNWHHMPQTYA